jgi:hypothetical protein
MGHPALCWVEKGGLGLCRPTLAAEKSRKDGARKFRANPTPENPDTKRPAIVLGLLVDAAGEKASVDDENFAGDE